MSESEVKPEKIEGEYRENISEDSLSAESSRSFFYGLTWPGKEAALREGDLPFIGSLVRMDDPDHFSGGCCRGRDMVIEGDNLEALKLLEAEYGGKIRFIYIDPPYNTGKQFTYRDHFRGIGNRFNGKPGRPGKNDPTSNLLYHHHIPWLNMIFPRLAVARKLLRDDGIIYVSIDDTEVHNLVLLMDEVFGEENRVGIISWVKKKKGSHLSKKLRCVTEYILVYGKDASRLDLWGEDAYRHKWQPLIKRINREQVLNFEGGVVETTLPASFYPAGIYGRGGTSVELLDDIHIRDSCIVNPFSIRARTVWTQEYLDRELALGTRVSIRSTGMGPNVFRHDQASKKKRPPTLLDERMGVGTNEDAWNELREIFAVENIYSYPKPVSLIRYLIRTVSRDDPSGIYMDFFAGSGTTGQAVWEANREDGGNRRFILVQSPESLEKPVVLPGGVFREKISTISELCIERLFRVAGKMEKSGDPVELPEIYRVESSYEQLSVDRGFRIKSPEK